MPLPGYLSSGLVTGYWARWVIDGPDDDRDPDIIDESNIVLTFTAEVFPSRQITTIEYPNATPPATYIAEPIEVVTNLDGVLVDAYGMEGIRLVSNKTPGSVPKDWKWHVIARRNGIIIADKLFDVPENGSVDLTSVTPIVAGTPLPVWWSALTTLETYVKTLGVGGGGGGAVASVNGKVGTVILTAADVKARSATWVPTIADIQNLETRLGDFVLRSQIADLAPAPEGPRSVLVTDPDAKLINLNYSAARTANTIVQRNASGQIATAEPTDDTHASTKKYVDDKTSPLAPKASPAFTGTPTGITKAHVGLDKVDNTTDAQKPISSLQQVALDGKVFRAGTGALRVWDVQTALPPLSQTNDGDLIPVITG